MGLIYNQMILEGDRGNKEVTTLFDPGSSQSFARRDIAEQVSTIGKTPMRLKFETATEVVETEQVIFAQVWFDGNLLFWTFIVVPDLTEELILGSDFFQRWKIQRDPEPEKITLDPSALKLKRLLTDHWKIQVLFSELKILIFWMAWQILILSSCKWQGTFCLILIVFTISRMEKLITDGLRIGSGIILLNTFVIIGKDQR